MSTSTSHVHRTSDLLRFVNPNLPEHDIIIVIISEHVQTQTQGGGGKRKGTRRGRGPAKQMVCTIFKVVEQHVARLASLIRPLLNSEGQRGVERG